MPVTMHPPSSSTSINKPSTVRNIVVVQDTVVSLENHVTARCKAGFIIFERLVALRNTSVGTLLKYPRTCFYHLQIGLT